MGHRICRVIEFRTMAGHSQTFVLSPRHTFSRACDNSMLTIFIVLGGSLIQGRRSSSQTRSDTLPSDFLYIRNFVMASSNEVHSVSVMGPSTSFGPTSLSNCTSESTPPVADGPLYMTGDAILPYRFTFQPFRSISDTDEVMMVINSWRARYLHLLEGGRNG